MAIFIWHRAERLESMSYVCGYCGDKVGSDTGYWATQEGTHAASIYACPSCGRPSFFDDGTRQWPGVAFGATVDALPVDVATVYDEARRCMSVSAYSTAVMACRKLLMHIAVEKGAEEGKSFRHYVDWLVDNHFVPPDGRGWADQIRGRGNEANHEIDLIERHEAEQIVSFVELLLKFVYELPARVGVPASST